MEIIIGILIIICFEFYYRTRTLKKIISIQQESIRLQKETIAYKNAIIQAYKSIMKSCNIDIQ